MFIYIYIYIYVYMMHVYIYASCIIYVFMCICIYKYVCMNIYIYIYTRNGGVIGSHTHIYISHTLQIRAVHRWTPRRTVSEKGIYMHIYVYIHKFM